MEKKSIKTFVEKFKKGEFDNENLRVQIEAGWYDWFCKDTSLKNKTKKLGNKLLQIMNSEKIDSEKNYVWFKNNCPMSGPLYDDFRISDIESGDVIYTIIPKCGHTGKAELWGKENNFNVPIISGKWKDIKDFFNK
jgi:hypothetical protein